MIRLQSQVRWAPLPEWDRVALRVHWCAEALWKRLEALEAGVALQARRAKHFQEAVAGIVSGHDTIVDAGTSATVWAEQRLSLQD